MTTLFHRTATGIVAKNLSACLLLRRGSLNLLAFRVPIIRILAGSDRLLFSDLLAFVIIVDAITRATSDLYAGVSIGP